MRSIWLVICALYQKSPFIVSFLTVVVIANLTALFFGATWLSLLLGLVLSLTSVFFLRRLIKEEIKSNTHLMKFGKVDKK